MAERKDYPPAMHTAEHILNGTMNKIYGKGRAFSAHIERRKSKCDYKGFNKILPEKEIAELERKVNEVIAENLPVVETFLPRVEASKLFNLDRLPDAAGDTLRIISVGEYDACPCIGEHVSNTSEIGRFKINSQNFNGERLRIIFKLEEQEAK